MRVIISDYSNFKRSNFLYHRQVFGRSSMPELVELGLGSQDYGVKRQQYCPIPSSSPQREPPPWPRWPRRLRGYLRLLSLRFTDGKQIILLSFDKMVVTSRHRFPSPPALPLVTKPRAPPENLPLRFKTFYLTWVILSDYSRVSTHKP